jgi:hypothetical protein
MSAIKNFYFEEISNGMEESIEEAAMEAFVAEYDKNRFEMKQVDVSIFHSQL